MRISNKVLGILAAAILASGGVAAQAASVTFNFSSAVLATSARSYNFTDAGTGLGVTVAAFTINPSLALGSVDASTTPASAVRVARGTNGLGVQSPSETGGTASNRINGYSNLLEGLSLDFSPASVTMTGMTFNFVGATDNARVRVQAGDLSQNPLFLGSLPGNSLSLNNTALATTFDLIAVDSNDEYVLESVTVDYTPSVVPLPSAVIGGGVLVLGRLLGRRR